MTNETQDQTINEACINPTEADERAHLARVTGKIGEALQHLSQQVAARHTEMIKLKAFLHEHKGDMDHAEKITVRQASTLACSSRIFSTRDRVRCSN